MVFTATRSFGPLGARGALVARDPRRPFAEFARFDRAFAAASTVPGTFLPRLDVVEDDDAFRITAEVPGVEEADLSVEIEDGVLTLKGEKKSSFVAEGESEASGEAVPSKSRFHRVETRSGSFERRLRFNAEVDEEAVQASYRNGVLSIVIPKIAEAAPAVRTVPVQTA